MENKFMNTIIKAIIFVAILFSIVFVLSIYVKSFGSSSENKDIEKKYEDEIRYLDIKILSLVNYLNNIDLQNYRVVITKVATESDTGSSSEKTEQNTNETEDNAENGTDKEETTLTKMEEETIVQENNEVDWKTIEGELEILCSTWPSIVLDLYNKDIKSEDIVGFSDALDQAIINAENKDKNMTAMYLAKLYGYLPTFLGKIQTEEMKQEAIEAKSYIVNAYSYVQTDDWERVDSEVERARNLFSSLVNDPSLINSAKKYNINKSYIVIEELKNSISSQDKGIFYMKYKDALEELNVLS